MFQEAKKAVQNPNRQANLSNQTMQTASACNFTKSAYSNQAQYHCIAGVPPIQRVRYPTCYTYLKTPSHCKLSPDSCQGPHTVAHAFLEFLVNNYLWNELYEEQIMPYPPATVEAIIRRELEGEESAEGGQTVDKNELTLRIDRFMQDYQTLYTYLDQANTDGLLSGDPDPSYREPLLKIMSMHPYGSYCWKPPQEATRTELKGKGEGAMVKALKKSYEHGQEINASFVWLPDDKYRILVDDLYQSKFSRKEDAQKFMKIRIKDILHIQSLSQSKTSKTGLISVALKEIQMIENLIDKKNGEFSLLELQVFRVISTIRSTKPDPSGINDILKEINTTIDLAEQQVNDPTDGLFAALVSHKFQQAKKKFLDILAQTDSGIWIQQLQDVNAKIQELLSRGMPEE